MHVVHIHTSLSPVVPGMFSLLSSVGEAGFVTLALGAELSVSPPPPATPLVIFTLTDPGLRTVLGERSSLL